MNFYIDYYKLGHIAGRLLFLIFIIGIAVAIIKKENGSQKALL